MSGKKVLVISSSPRRMGNSDLLADAFIEGAREAGHTVEKINLHFTGDFHAVSLLPAPCISIRCAVS